jgi:hypothetical protein
MHSLGYGRRERPMKTVMVRYKVKPDRAAENESYISKVFEQLDRRSRTLPVRSRSAVRLRSWRS